MTDHDPLCPQHLQYPGHRSRCICVLLREADARARADERERILAELEGPARESEAMYAHAEAAAAKLVEVIVRDDLRRELLEAKADRLSLMWQAACNERDAARAEVERLRSPEWEAEVRADERARAYPGREVRSQLIGAYAQLSHAEAVAARLVEVICRLDNAALYWQERAHNAWAQLDEGGVDFLAVLAERDAARAEVATLREQVANDWAMDLDLARRRVLADLRAKVEGLRSVQSMYDGQAIVPDPATVRAVLALIEEADMPRSVFDAPAGAATKPLDGDQ